MNIYELKGVKTEVGDFSLSIPNCTLSAGRVYAVVGPNACGKTTFLNLLSLLSAPCEGEVFFSGEKIRYTDRSNLLAKRRKIAYLTQNPYLFNMSIYENVSFGLRLRGFPQTIIHKKVEEILSVLSLSGLSRKNAHELSGGEAQRVALARTLALESSVFLLDEPTANVDKGNIRELEELILSLNREKGATVILTTHSQEQAYRMSKNIISIVNGRIKDIAYENVFSGILEEEESGLKSVRLKNNLRIKVSSGQKGAVTIAVDPQDIILSRECLDSSALNNFYGTITKLEEINGSLRVYVEAASPRGEANAAFCALITHHSFYNMKLNIGKEVWVTFKANSVKTI
jgi:tungstate transport system ATP-binding protein